MRRLSLVLLLVAVSGPAMALDCKNGSDQTSLSECADQAFKTADGQMNAVYKQVQDRLAHAASPNAKADLTEAQRNWVTFRDAECKFKASDSEGGSMHSMVVLGCRTALTQKRVADLNAYLSCKADDGDCPTAPAP